MIKDDDGVSENVSIITFCGLIENWNRIKNKPSNNAIIFDKSVSCAINNYRHVKSCIEPYSLKGIKYRKFEIKRSDID